MLVMHRAYNEEVRTTVSIQDPLLAEARRLAAQRGATLSSVVEDALRAWIAARPPAKPEPFRLHTVKGRLVDPLLDLDRTSGLLLRDDDAAFGPKRK
jgi:hypothetical protein